MLFEVISVVTKPINLQDSFLNQVRKENVGVTVHLVNGFQIKGNVRGFDSFTVIIDSMGKQQMIYKHAISTVTPARPINTNFANEKPEKRMRRDGSRMILPFPLGGAVFFFSYGNHYACGLLVQRNRLRC